MVADRKISFATDVVGSAEAANSAIKEQFRNVIGVPATEDLGNAAFANYYPDGAPPAPAITAGAVALDFTLGPVHLQMTANVTATTFVGLALYQEEGLLVTGHASSAFTWQKESNMRWPTAVGSAMTVAAGTDYRCTVYRKADDVYLLTIGDPLT